MDDGRRGCQTSCVPGTLYVVATPIGNLDDMTFRAVEILRSVSRIACEDTRVTGRLCQRFEVTTKLLRHDANNEAASTEGLIALLAEDHDIALVSDAGTPCIHDPGQRLIAATAEAGFPVVPIPGASSLLAALSASGLPIERFTFHGFVPKRDKERATLLSTLGPGTHAFYVPARDLPELTAHCAELHPLGRVVVARELTKLHETFVRGSATRVAEHYADEPPPKGEAVVLMHLAPKPTDVSDQDIARALVPLLRGGVHKKAAATEISERLSVSKRRVYQLAVRL